MTDPLTDIITSVRSKLQDELDTQLRAVGDKHAEAVATARRDAELEAEQRWSALLEEARNETQRQVDAAAAAARQTAVEPTPAVPDESLAILLKGVTRVAASDSLVAALNTIAGCARDLGEASLLVLSGSHLQPWPDTGAAHPTDELVREVLVSKTTARSDVAIAVPLLLDDAVVAVLYGKGGDPATTTVVDAMEALARFGSAHLANLTLVRTAQAQQWIADSTRLYGGAPTTDTGQEASEEDEAAAARRFARLLVSEIKLYNEGAVRVGRERRDLLQRLGEEIDRARRLYEERVPATVPSRAQHFHNELVQTLAGGDSALLG